MPLIDCNPSSLRGELPFLQEQRLVERLQQIGFDTAGRIWCEYDPETRSLTFRQGHARDHELNGPDEATLERLVVAGAWIAQAIINVEHARSALGREENAAGDAPAS